MLPVVATAATVARKILGLLLRHGRRDAGAGAVRGLALRRLRRGRLGAWFLVEAHRLRGRVAGGGAPAPMRLFHLSICYLTLLFAVIAVTALLPAGRW